MSALGQRARCPGIQPTVEIAVRRCVMPTSGSRRAGGEHVVEVHHRLAHAHEDAGGRPARCGGSAAPGRGSPTPSGCGRTSSRRSRRTCTSAGSRTARRGRASGGRRGSASAPPRPGGRRAVWNSALTVPSRGVRLVLERRASRTGPRSASRVAQRRRAGRSSRRSRRRRAPPTPTPGRRGRRARRASASVVSSSSRSIGRPMVARRCASPSTSPTPASPRAAPPSSSIVRRPRHASTARSSPTRRATSTAASRVAVDGKPRRAPTASARRLRAQQAARRRLDRQRHARAARPSSTSSPSDRRLYPVGRLDADTTGLILLTDDGELAHRLTHPRFEVPKTYRATVGGPPVRDARAAARCARASSSRTA